MRVLGIDLETTGLDVSKDRPIELGICLWETNSNQPIVSRGFYLWEATYPPVAAEALKTHGIQLETLHEFGEHPREVLSWLEGFITRHRVDALCAHNGNGYDKPLLLNEIKRHGIETPNLQSLHWIDTSVDFPEYGKSRSLLYLSAEAGFLNPFPHRAQFDVLSMLKLLSRHNTEEIVKNGKIPKVTLRGRLAPGEQDFDKKKDWLKSRRYMWDGVNKFWIKDFKETEVDNEKQEALRLGIKLVIQL